MKAGLTGYPIAHSLSPRLHNAAYRELGLDWQYSLYADKDEPAFLTRVSAAAAAGEYVGFNVTMPYKVAAMALCDELDPLAVAAGGVNVLTFAGGRILGANTDGPGIVGSLERDAGAQVRGAGVAICGTGPTAHAAAIALQDAGAASVVMLSRRAGNAARVSRAGSDVRILPYSEASGVLKQASILIDATPLGMNPDDPPAVPPELLEPRHTVLDVVYGHGRTALIQAAEAIGAKAIDGLGMLIEQAALTIEIWTAAQGTPLAAPREAMRAAVG